jgi:hypothetical protein
MTESSENAKPGVGSAELPTADLAASIPRSPEVPVTASAITAVTTGDNARSLEWAFLLNEQRYLIEFVRFADQKAAFANALPIGVLAFLYNAEIYVEFTNDVVLWIQSHPSAAVASLMMVASFGCLLGVVLPRLWMSSDHTLTRIFWEDVAAMGSAEKYSEQIMAAGSDKLHQELAVHCFTLARICTRKYELLKFGMWSAAAGAVAGAIALL